MHPYLFTDPLECCRVICLLYGVSAALTFTEKLINSEDYATKGWLTWKIFRFDRSHLPIFRSVPNLLQAVFGKLGMAIVLSFGLLGVITMWLSPVGSTLFSSGIAATVLTFLVIHARSTYGGDGSQQMNVLISIAILVGFNPWVKPAVGSVCLIFIAAQSCLAYLTSGTAKLISPIWMTGDALPKIMSTKAYGCDVGFRIISRTPRLSRVLCVSVVLLEASFPVCLIGPSWLLFAFLFWGMAFHVSNAFLMGLNTFLWSFIATYPAVCYTWFLLHG